MTSARQGSRAPRSIASRRCPPTSSISSRRGSNIPSADQTKRCFDELTAKGVPLAAYNTTQNALDLPVIMSALGYRDYNIYGISYGTKLGLEVMRVAPQNVRSVILDGVAPSWVNLYNSFAMKTDEAIQHLVDHCAADRVCNEAYPELGRIVVETLNKAAKGRNHRARREGAGRTGADADHDAQRQVQFHADHALHPRLHLRAVARQGDADGRKADRGEIRPRRSPATPRSWPRRRSSTRGRRRSCSSSWTTLPSRPAQARAPPAPWKACAIQPRPGTAFERWRACSIPSSRRR